VASKERERGNGEGNDTIARWQCGRVGKRCGNPECSGGENEYLFGYSISNEKGLVLFLFCY
jgi:hypothetical protein